METKRLHPQAQQPKRTTKSILVYLNTIKLDQRIQNKSTFKGQMHWLLPFNSRSFCLPALHSISVVLSAESIKLEEEGFLS
jgi:hypothetical protein